MTAKDKIIKLFKEKVKGKKPNTSNKNQRHDGRQGHWLEQQFGIEANGDNEPDLYGYELKNETTSKTTFGDWSANQYVFTNPKYEVHFTGSCKHEKQDGFLKIFGKANENKKGRFSWSGSPCPKICGYNDFGQKLIITAEKDIQAIYSYSKDKRPNKNEIVPKELQIEQLIIAHWFGILQPAKGKCLKDKLEDKFNRL